MRRQLFLIIALLCAVAQGAWAQTTNVSNEAELRDAISNGANITLTQDITIGDAITFNDGITVTINLGGFTLNRGCTSRGSQVIGVYSGGTLYLSNGTVTGGWGGGGGGMFNEGTMHLTSVTITGNTADDRGGGISNNGTLTMTGCTVSNNTSRDAVDPAGGGGIFNYSGKTATLTNCTITGNTANTYGGGGICNYGTMTLENCSVKNNNANTTGGGIFCSTTSTLSINGCDITGNSAVSYGDGIYIDNSTLNMQGLCTVTGNNDGNIYLYGSGTKITVTGAFTDGSNIGVGFTDYGRKFTSGYSTYNDGTDPGNFFSSDNYKYGIGEKDGEAYAGVSYVERSWTGENTTGHVVKETKVCTDYTTYSSNTNDNSLGGGWYLLSGTFTFNKRVTIDGDVKFILQDGCNVEFDKGIFIKENKTLTIYGQRDDSGYLWTDGSDGENAAIGGNEDTKGGNLVIHGGRIYAKPGSNNCAAIGAGNGSNAGMQGVTIYGGTITAEGKSSGSGIGGGQGNFTKGKDVHQFTIYYHNKVPVTIYGGTVTAKGGNYAAGIGGGEKSNSGEIKIFSGTVTATGGKHGAGIGGGEYNSGGGDQGDIIYIYGGTVTATAGEGGAGIGGGYKGDQKAEIKIYDATVTATAGKEGAGIGGGRSGSMEKEISVHGGTVYATGGEKGTGIGGGYDGDADHLKIYSGSKVYAKGGKHGAGVGAGYKEGTGYANDMYVQVYGGYLEATSTGGDAACIGGSKGNRACWSVVVYDDAVVKCVYTDEVSNEFSNSQYIGRGGDDDNNPEEWEFKIPSHSVTKDGSKALADNRQSTCKLHPSGYSTILIEPCDHEGGSFTYKDTEKHTVSCSYCDSSEENHDTNGDGGSCSKCGKGATQKTVTLYEAKSDGSGYSSTPFNYTTTLGATYTLPSCSSVPSDMLFVGWKAVTADAPASIEATDDELASLTAAGTDITVEADVTYYARYQSTIWPGGGTGTASDPYIISEASHWDKLASSVENKKVDFNGKYIKMTKDISVTTMVGTSSTRFRGNFNGDGHTLTVDYSSSEEACAPFRYTYGATIQNLKTAGTIATSNIYAGGVVGMNFTGRLTLYNVISSVTINSSYSGNACHGGLMGYAINANIERSAFTGELLGTSTSKCGGFLGFKSSTDGSSVNIKNCLFMPTQVTISTSNSNTFATGTTDKVTVTNSYYTQTFGNAQGTRSYTIESGTNGLYLYYGNDSETIAELESHENEVRAYDNGLLYQKKFYTGGTSNVTFTPLTSTYGQGATSVTPSTGTLTNNGDGTYTLAMNNANSTVTASIETYGGVTLNDTPTTVTNTATIETNIGQTKNVTLSGRKLYKDGDWNTLCLPFDVSEDYMKNSDHPLYGATIKELDTEGWYDNNGDAVVPGASATGLHQTGFDAETGTLYLYFKTATEIEARHPYLISWAAATPNYFEDPVFNNSYIESRNPTTVTSTDGTISFVGNFDPVPLTAGDKTVLYLGADNKLYYPAETSTGRSINAFRGYFQLNGITAGDVTNGARIFFGEDDYATGIISNKDYKDYMDKAGAGWYDLQGRKVANGQWSMVNGQLKKGIYIYNGKKRVIK